MRQTHQRLGVLHRTEKQSTQWERYTMLKTIYRSTGVLQIADKQIHPTGELHHDENKHQ